MSFPGVRLPDVLPSPLKDLLMRGGQGVGDVTAPVGDVAQGAFSAYSALDPSGAEALRGMNPNTPSGLLALMSLFAPGPKGMRMEGLVSKAELAQDAGAHKMVHEQAVAVAKRRSRAHQVRRALLASRRHSKRFGRRR